MKSTSTLTRRGLLGIAVSIPVVTGLPFGFVGEAHANDQPVSGDPPHGGGYYRFNIGKFKATVISDGYGNVPFWPILAANQESSTVEAFLREKRISPEPQFTNNLLVVDTPTDRFLVDTGFGDVLGPIPVISLGC